MYYSIPQFTMSFTFFTTILLIHSPEMSFACSSRTIPRARPSTSSSISATPLPITIPTTTTARTTTTTTTTPRPNITFPTYKCPADFDRWFCLNAATCFSVKIGESVMYNCECALGFTGSRCEYKELDGSYLPQRPRPMLEKASIASGAACALFFMFFICLTLYLRYDHQKLKCIDDDGNILDDMMLNDERCDVRCRGDDKLIQFNCRFCCEANYCCDAGNVCGNNTETNDTDLLTTAEKYPASALRQYFENISPLSFATRRSIKI